MKRILLPAVFLLAFSLPVSASEQMDPWEKLNDYVHRQSTSKTPLPFPVDDNDLTRSAASVKKLWSESGFELTDKQMIFLLGVSIHMSQSLTQPTESQATEPSQPQSLPSYDSGAYCDKIAERAGGSNSIRKGCMQNETNAKRTLSTLSIPEKTVNYCDRIAKRAGGSYWIFHGCIINEMD